MPTDISKKLRVKEGDTLLTLNAPAGFNKAIGTLPPGVKIKSVANRYNQVHWFVLNKVQMEKETDKVLKLLKDDVLLWIYYPKGTSKIQTDLTRDKGWDTLMAHGKLQWVSLVSFDDTWSAFACRLKTERDEKREAKPREQPVLDYIDTGTKTVRLPDDLAKALKTKKKQLEFFNALSFSNRKEYVEWIVTAKRKETRDERISGTVERLGKGWKNPGNT